MKINTKTNTKTPTAEEIRRLVAERWPDAKIRMTTVERRKGNLVTYQDKATS